MVQVPSHKEGQEIEAKCKHRTGVLNWIYAVYTIKKLALIAPRLVDLP